LERVLGIPGDQILQISAKTGEGVPELLHAVIERIPAPKGDPSATPGVDLRLLLRPVRGVISSIRIVNGPAW